MVRKLNQSSLGRGTPTSFMKAKSRLPITPPLPASPKARLNTTATQRMASSPMAKTFCISMPRTFLPRTMPP